MPGRSTTVTGLPSTSARPSFFSTVTPGQLPTYWLEPVRALKRGGLAAVGIAHQGQLHLRVSWLA